MWLLASRLHQTVERNWQNRAAGVTNAGIVVWLEKEFHRHSLSASALPHPHAKKQTNSCALHSNYTLLSVFSAPVSSIFPRFSCLRCRVPSPRRREREPLVLPEWTILSRLISKGSGEPLYCQRALLWRLHLLNQARKLFIHFEIIKSTAIVLTFIPSYP